MTDFRHNKSTEPPVWDLSKLVPEFKGLTPETLRPAFDEVCDALLAEIAQTKQKLYDATHKEIPNGRAISEVLDARNRLTVQCLRIDTFTYLLGDEHAHNPLYQELAPHLEERIAFIQYSLDDVWSASELSEEAVDKLIKEANIHPTWKAHLISQSTSEPYVSLKEIRADAEAEAPLLADYKNLYTILTTADHDSPKEKADIATRLINAKLYQEWQTAEEQGSTPLAIAAEKSGLKPSVFEEVLKSGSQIQQSLQELTGINLTRSSPFSADLNVDPEFNWSDAATAVSSGFSQFDKGMGAATQEQLEGEWIHAAPTPHKTKHKAGYSQTLNQYLHPGLRSYIFMHLDGNARDIRILGHETGHSIQGHLNGDSVKGAFGELAAHFAEKLTYGEGGRNLAEPLQPPLDATALDNLLYFAGGQDNLGVFETALYNRFKEADGAPLTTKEIAKIYRTHVLQDRPDYLSEEERVCEIAADTVFVNYAPFYYSNYQLAELGANALYEKYLALEKGKERQAFAAQWKEIITNSEKYNYASALSKMGIDVSSADALIAPTIKHAERLIQWLQGDLEEVYAQAYQQLEACERDTTGHAEKVMRERLKEREQAPQKAATR